MYYIVHICTRVHFTGPDSSGSMVGGVALAQITKKPLVTQEVVKSEVGSRPQIPSSKQKGGGADEYQVDLEECIAKLISKAGSLR